MPGERRSAIRDVTTLDIDSRSSATEYWRHRLLSLTHLRSGLVRRARIWPRVVSGGRGLVGEAHTQGKSRVSHRPLRQGRHAGRCGAAGARTVRARAVVACASVLSPERLLCVQHDTRSPCRLSAKTRQRREHDDNLEGHGAAYVSTFRGEEGRIAISSTAGLGQRFDVSLTVSSASPGVNPSRAK